MVPGSRRAMHELAPGGHFETFRHGLLGLLHEMIPTSGAGQNKRRHRRWQGETAGRGRPAIPWRNPAAGSADFPAPRAENGLTSLL
jgi:hypothetical protein